MDIVEYQGHDAVGLAGLVAQRLVSPTELLDVAQQIAADRNPSINAITQDLDGFARSEIARGLPLGPFRGVPFLLKDQFQQLTGTVTTASCKVLATTVADHDSTLTARYRAAGLVIFAKTNTPELALSPTETGLATKSRGPALILPSGKVSAFRTPSPVANSVMTDPAGAGFSTLLRLPLG